MQKLLRVGLRLLSAIAPGAAGRVGARFWFGIPRPRVHEDARKFLQTGTRFEVAVGESRVVGWKWGTGPTVLLLHGWGGYAGQLTAFVNPLVACGFAVIAIDAPSHGESSPGALGPRRATLFDFSDTLLAVTRDLPRVAGVIAHSGGCAAVAWWLTRATEPRPERIVFVAPFARPSRYMAAFQRTLGLSDKAMQKFRESSERQFNFRWADFEVPEIADRVATPPLLVIHDKDDRETAWQDGADIAAKWPNARIESTSGLGHNRILRDAATVERAVQFIANGVS
jgi:pimeloyl-ACP methyl ester carboxylesterase